MGIRLGGLAGGFDTNRLVEQLIEAERIPINTAKQRKERVEQEKEAFDTLRGHLSALDSAMNNLKTETDFYKLKVESSHPDIIDGVVDGPAMLGTYEFEVRGMARNEKELAYGFPDKDETYVGFGFLYIEREDKEGVEVEIEPQSTLEDVARQINQQEAGVRALIMNTKYKPDSFRLLVISEDSGQEAKILLDEDTTNLEFREQVTGRNLDVLFEDVPVTDEDNTLEELLDSVVFNVKRSEPGTRVQVSVTYDIDTSLEDIRAFVDAYNEVARFVHGQFEIDPETQRAGLLSGDSSIKSILRQLQQSFQGAIRSPDSKYSTLAEAGITTNPKTGEIELDESKMKQALSEDYEGVARLFIRSRYGNGVAERLGRRLRNFRDPGTGILTSRTRGLDTIIKNQDKEIERKERNLAQKEESIRRRFTALEGRLADLQGQGQFLAARFGGGAPAGGGGG